MDVVVEAVQRRRDRLPRELVLSIPLEGTLGRRRQAQPRLPHLRKKLSGAKPASHDVQAVTGELGLELRILGPREPDQREPGVELDVGGEPVDLLAVGAGAIVGVLPDPRPRRVVRPGTCSL